MRLTEEQLTAELRAIRPLPEPAFAAGLDRRAADGFPGRSGGERRGVRLPQLRLRQLAPAAAGLAMLAVVSVVAISQIDSDAPTLSEEELPSAQPTREAAPAGAGGSGAGAAGDTAVAPGEPTTMPLPTSPDLAPNASKRAVERTVSMTLSTEPDELREVADGVVEVTDRYKGIVVSSQVREGEADRSRASFELRVPTARLQDALADLSALAHVQSRNEGSLDITGPVVDARERIADAQTKAERAAARQELRALLERANLTPISLTVVAEGDGSNGWSIGEAADDAASVLESVAGIALVSAAVLLPLALLATVVWLAGGRVLRRRRERALDRTR